MAFPKFLDGKRFAGLDHFWAVINGRVWRSEPGDDLYGPYQKSFGWHAGKDFMRYNWAQGGPQTAPVNLRVEECYSTRKAATRVQQKIKCRCGQLGELRFAKTYDWEEPPQNPVAVGVWCGKCWPGMVARKRGIEVSRHGKPVRR